MKSDTPFLTRISSSLILIIEILILHKFNILKYIYNNIVYFIIFIIINLLLMIVTIHIIDDLIDDDDK